MANKKAREQEIQAANKRKHELAKKTLWVWPYVTIGAIALTLILMFVPFIDIYNNPNVPGAFSPSANGGRPFTEIGASGWQTFVCALTQDYTSAQSPFGPFYYWVEQTGGNPWITLMGISTLVAVIAVVLSLSLQIGIAITKAHRLSLLGIALDFVAAAAFIITFVAALSCSGDMITQYCNSNPACSLRSFAILPALFALGTIVLDAFHFLKSKQVDGLMEREGAR